MTPRLADYIEAGRALDADERLEAAHQLLLSVEHDSDADQVSVDAEWDAAVERRLREVLDGSASVVDGSEQHARVRAEIAARRA